MIEIKVPITQSIACILLYCLLSYHVFGSWAVRFEVCGLGAMQAPVDPHIMASTELFQNYAFHVESHITSESSNTMNMVLIE